jgi:hypothetical protein
MDWLSPSFPLSLCFPQWKWKLAMKGVCEGREKVLWAFYDTSDLNETFEVSATALHKFHSWRSLVLRQCASPFMLICNLNGGMNELMWKTQREREKKFGLMTLNDFICASWRIASFRAALPAEKKERKFHALSFQLFYAAQSNSVYEKKSIITSRGRIAASKQSICCAV